jgi:hypothetical protein
MTMPGRTSSKLLEKLNDDCLNVFLEQVYLMDQRTLFKLSLASRYLYSLTRPWIYRDITVDLTKVTHGHLLRRLLRHGSRLPSFIRNLEIRLSIATEEDLQKFKKLISGLTNLKTLTCVGSVVGFPDSLADVFSKHHSKAALELPDEDWSRKRLNIKEGRWGFFQHPAASQLTVFHFCPDLKDQLYYGFKTDLVGMLSRSTALRNFMVAPKFKQSIVFPEMKAVFVDNNFPQLESFTVNTIFLDIFTPRELSIWGEKGGWDRLT